jgi:hypothetical protein
VWGYGQDDEWLIPAAVVFDVRTGRQERWFPGPKGTFFFDKYLFSADPQDGLTAWDIDSGARVAHEPGFCPTGYHQVAKQFLAIAGDGRIQVSRVVHEPEPDAKP